MLQQDVIDPRELQLEGSVNFRDLGGLATMDNQRVRTGFVFRSDALHGLTTADLDVLAAHRIALLVDLRSPGEIERSGPSPLLASGSRVLHAPIMQETGAPREIDPEMRMEALYATMLDNAQSRFGEIFVALAEAPNMPAVIHCSAGKDRTGVTVALLLRLLGVSDEAIVRDYAMTDRNMSRLMARLASLVSDIGRPSYPAHFMRATPDTMEAFLVSLDATYGSADAYLREAGVSGDHVDALRARLLEPAG
jgi:protein tyrosine/serine phosphatase